MSSITLGGDSVTVAGVFPKVGDSIEALSFISNDLGEVSLADFASKRKVLNIFPSIDTGICAQSVRVFNKEAAALANTVVLCVSADLPFAQARFCGAEGLDNVQTVSVFRNPKTAETLGVAMTSGALAGLTARAVIVLDEKNVVVHSELVPEIKQEPNYQAALAALN